MFLSRTSTTARSLAAALAASAVLAAGAGQADAALYNQRGHTPSGNIACRASNYGGSYWKLTCSVKRPGYSVTMNNATGKPKRGSYKRIASGGKTLRYGHKYRLGAFRCLSTSVGLACRSNQTGHGFAIAKEGWRRI